MGIPLAWVKMKEIKKAYTNFFNEILTELRSAIQIAPELEDKNKTRVRKEN